MASSALDAHYYRLGGGLGQYFVFYDYDDNEVGRVLFKAIHSLRRMIDPGPETPCPLGG